MDTAVTTISIDVEPPAMLHLYRAKKPRHHISLVNSIK
jgi:hypothetical protein